MGNLKSIKTVLLRTACFAPTFAVIIYLAQLLAVSFKRVFVLVLDKLFLNIDVARVLFVLNVASYGADLKTLPGFLPI